MYFKAIQESIFYALRDGMYDHKTVPVFCGFDRYKDSVQAVIEISNAVIAEWPQIGIENMTVHRVRKTQSRRHAHMMTVLVVLDAGVVRDNLRDYTIL